MLILNTILVIESKHMCISFLIFGKCLYFFNFYWGRVTPQCWVNFCCTMNPNSNPIQWSESTICICTSKELYSMLCDDLNGKETHICSYNSRVRSLKWVSLGWNQERLRGVAKMAEKNDPEFISSHGKTKTIIHRAAIDENYPWED